MESNQLRGGIRVGYYNATWPFVTLKVDRKNIVLKVFGHGVYTFRPSEVTAVTRVGELPFIGRGVQIHHKKHYRPLPFDTTSHAGVFRSVWAMIAVPTRSPMQLTVVLPMSISR